MSQPRPAPSKINLASLRHQLLTSLNHIIGYSEMLLEGDREGFDQVRQDLARIRQTGRDMVQMVRTSLGPHPGKRTAQVLGELRYQMTGPLHSILQAVGAVTGGAHPELEMNDVMGIARAAAELLTFAQGGVIGNGTVPASPAGTAPRTHAAGRILVVEDNETNRHLLTRQLRRQGHQVTEASSGAHALQLLVEAPQDVVLLDMLMPKLDGFQVLERIKSDPALQPIPVIVISALDEVPGIVRCLEMGAEDYLFKPIRPVLLAARIHSSLERKRLHDLETQRARDLENAYRRLHESEERLRLALRAGRARIWDWDLNTNRLTEEGRTQHSLDEALAVIDQEDRERVRAAAREAVELREELHCEFRVTRRGETRWMESMGRLDRSGEGEPRRMIGVTRDITRRKRAEEDLRRSNEEFQRFAMIASHDLREPLRAVSSELETLLATRQSAGPARVLRATIAKLGRMSKLISDLLDYSQIGARTPARRPVSAEAVLGLVRSDLKITIEENGARITHGKLPVLSTDFVLLQRLFQNLVANSIKYRRAAPPRIRVSARCEGATWIFCVSDNGAGIDPKDCEAIFGLFHRAHSSKTPGSGLGLAICRRIVEQLGGKIWVESKPGQGSAFYFSIPGSLIVSGG